MFDINSFSHITHGVLLRHFVTNQFAVALLFEVLWFENTALVERYQRYYPTYRGDSPKNVLGDVISMTIGFLFATHQPILAVILVILCELFIHPNFITLVKQWVV